MKITDVLVIGGGPAGTAAALSLAASGTGVTVLERSGYDGARVGETLPPDAVPLLHRLGVWTTFVGAGHLPSPGIVSAWGDAEPFENDFIFNPYGNGWHVNRCRFDAMLATEAERVGAVVHRKTRVLSCTAEASGGWLVKVRSAGEVSSRRARFLIDATGRASWLGRRLGARRLACDRLVGVAGLFQADDGAGRDSRLLLEAAEHGWWYSAPLSDGRMAVAYMTDMDLLPAPPRDLGVFRAHQLRQTTLTRRRLEGVTPLGAIHIVAADSYRMERAAGEDWLAVGDAAMAWDPLSSQGLSKALKSGLAAAHAVGEARAGRIGALFDYGAELAGDFELYRRFHVHYYAQVRRWPGSPFWQRRQARLPDAPPTEPSP